MEERNNSPQGAAETFASDSSATLRAVFIAAARDHARRPTTKAVEMTTASTPSNAVAIKVDLVKELLPAIRAVAPEAGPA